eukprot:XP_001706820.1 Hypothetical protein GL50803_92625 [Giardia lamblia ATCC 50803]
MSCIFTSHINEGEVHRNRAPKAWSIFMDLGARDIDQERLVDHKSVSEANRLKRPKGVDVHITLDKAREMLRRDRNDRA